MTPVGGGAALRERRHLATAAHGPRGRRLIAIGLAVLAGLIALAEALGAGVHGAAALPDVLRAGAACVVLFGAAGYAPARLLVPRAMRPHFLLLVLPIGAAAAALELTFLGFAHVPLRISLPIVVGAGIVTGVTLRFRQGPVRPEPEPGERPEGLGLRLLWPAYIGLLVVAIALIPVFRSGFATVIGQNGDAVLAVGAAEFLQHAFPGQTNPDLPVDAMPLLWRSKYPIYYALAGVTQLSGLEAYKVFATVMAVMLGLVASSFFVFARYALRAGPVAALAVMALVPLDRIAMFLAIHPFHNQIWGLFSLPLILLFGLRYLQEPSRRSLAAFALFLALGAFAYPLMLPYPLMALGIVAVLTWRQRGAEGRRPGWIAGLRLPRGKRSWRSWIFWVPAALLALVVAPLLVKGIFEKSKGALEAVLPGSNLYGWRGVDGYLPFPRFVGVPEAGGLEWVLVAGVLGLALYGLWRSPRQVRIALGATLAGALLFALYFRERRYGDLFYFKDLGFAGPLIVTLAVVGLANLGRRARAPALRACAVAGFAALLALFAVNAGREINGTFDQLNPALIQMRSWSRELPVGSSIRVDVPPSGYQLWTWYMLHDHPLSSSDPLVGTLFPFPPVGRKADYVVAFTSRPRPRDAAGPPVFRNRQYAIYRMRPGVPGPDRSSKRLVQTVTENIVD